MMSNHTTASADEPLPWNTGKTAGPRLTLDPLRDIERYRFYLDKQPTEFFKIGALAHILGRKTDTIRGWQEQGWLPSPLSSYTGRDVTSEASRRHGKRRLYTKEQLHGIWKIAKEEGILEKHATPIRETQFAKRVSRLFLELSAKSTSHMNGVTNA